MKKLTFSAFAAALALVAVLALTPVQTADARPPYDGDPDDPLVQCWDAHLSVDKDHDGSYELGWNIATGSSYSSCLTVLSNMINHANSQGWAYANAHCYSYSVQGACRVSATIF